MKGESNMKTFATPEEMIAYAMSIKPRPRCYRSKSWNKRTARIGRYDRVKSPIFGRYYVDIQCPFGSDNKGVPESFATYEQAASYLEELGFEPVD